MRLFNIRNQRQTRRVAGWFMLVAALAIFMMADLFLTTKPMQSQAGATPTATDVRTCDDVIGNFTDAIDTCSSINEDWVCYASVKADALPEEFRFYDAGDQRKITDLVGVNVVDPPGSAILNLAIEGEAATMQIMIYGPADLIREHEPNSFRLSMDDNSRYLCEGTPPSMIIQTANNITGTITINGVRIDLASTALFTVDPDGTNTVVNVEGNVRVTVDGDTLELREGFQVQASVVEGFHRPQTPSEFYRSDAVDFLANHPGGLGRVRDINSTLLSCVATLDLAGDETTSMDDRIYVNSQECLYTFCAEAGDIVSLSAEPQGGELNPWIDLYGPDDKIVNFNDDISLENQNSLICNQALPESGCYTIVVRPHKNESTGRFRLLLAGASDCETPLDLCDITSLVGLNLRAGPGLEHDVLGTLGFTDRVIRFGRTPANDWIYVRTRADSEGWIRNRPRYVQCAPRIVPTISPTPTNTPSPTPTNTPKTKTPPPPTATLEPTKQSQYPLQ